MRIRFTTAAVIVVVVAAVSVSTGVYAAPLDTQTHMQFMLTKSKTVKFSFRNDSGSPVEVKAGDQIMSVDAGKTVVLKLVVGTKVVLNTAVNKHPAGELIAEATSNMNGTTVSIH